MDKFLIFIDKVDDAACYPLSSFAGMTVVSEGQIKMRFAPSFNPVGAADGDVDTVTISCNADTELKVFKSIANAISGGLPHGSGPDGYVVIGDDINSDYVDPNITGIVVDLAS